MIDVQLDTGPIQQRLDNMSEKIVHFGNEDMPEGLMRWQVEDMNRKYPNIQIVNNKTALTRIWPTSRLSLQRVRRLVLRRPILRPELFKVLCERMVQLMRDKLTWQ